MPEPISLEQLQHAVATLAEQHRRAVRANRALSVFVVALVSIGAASRASQGAPKELSVERLNIVDSTGRALLVLANGPRLPGPSDGGKSYPPSWVGRGRMAGMIFFNAEGDEVGGLVYDGQKREDGYSAFGHLSFDQWKQNQVVALQYGDDGRTRHAGLTVWDRPTDAPMSMQFEAAERMLAEAPGPRRDSLRAALDSARRRVAGIDRVFVGSRDRSAQIVLRDTKGRPRIRLVVDSTDVGRIEMLDASGAVTEVRKGG